MVLKLQQILPRELKDVLKKTKGVFGLGLLSSVVKCFLEENKGV